MTRNKFVDCTTSNNDGGGVYGWTIKTNLKCSKNTFSYCESNNHGGGFYVVNFNLSNTTNDPCISGCSFTKCNSISSSGGGIGILSPPTEFKMQNAIFISCNTKYDGGGFYFNCGTKDEVKRFLYCYFENNKAKTGFDAGMYLGSYNNEVGPFLLSFSTTIPKGSRTFWENKNKYFDWLKDGTHNQYMVSGKSDLTKDCGDSEEKACKNINLCIPKIESSGLWYIKIIDNVSEESSNTIWKNIFTEIKGDNKEITLINSVTSSLFSVLGVLKIVSFTLTSKDPSLFSVSSTGIVEITNLLIKCLFWNNN